MYSCLKQHSKHHNVLPDNLCLLLWSVHTALAFNSHLRSCYFFKFQKLKQQSYQKNLLKQRTCRILFHLTIMSICSLMNSLSLDISHVFAWNVRGLSLSILRCDLRCLTNRFYLVMFKKLTESISISGKLEKNQMEKSIAYLQKLFHSISHIQQT